MYHIQLFCVNTFSKARMITVLMVYTLSCFAQNRTNVGVEQAMQKYDQLIMGMNADSICMIYALNGELGVMAKGRDSIRNFLNTFKNFRVLSQSSESKKISMAEDSAYQTGTYRQTVIIPSNDTVTVKGSFKILWIWSGAGGWLIRRMETQPTQ
jgi:hypothetical protein